jgi:hypothetical protein
VGTNSSCLEFINFLQRESAGGELSQLLFEIVKQKSWLSGHSHFGQIGASCTEFPVAYRFSVLKQSLLVNGLQLLRQKSKVCPYLCFLGRGLCFI